MNSYKTIFCIVLIILMSGLSVPAKDEASYSQGMRCSLHCTDSVISMGTKLDCVLDLYFDSTQTSASTKYFYHYFEARSCSLHFTENNTGREYWRIPYESGMISYLDAEDIIELGKQPHITQEFTVYLLSDDGKYISPGSYSVSAIFQNTDPCREDLMNLQAQDSSSIKKYDDFWRARIISSPFQLSVMIATDSIVELKVNSDIIIKHADDDILWSLSEDSPRYIQVFKHPGYFLGQNINVWVLSDNDSILYGHRFKGQGRTKRTDIFFQKEQFYNIQLERVRSLSISNDSLNLKITNEIFETSQPWKHLWRAEDGDVNSLWKQEYYIRLD